MFFSTSLLPRNVKTNVYVVILVPVVLCGCVTWSFSLMEQHRLREFEYRVLLKVFGPNGDGDEAKGECRRLHNKELHDPYLTEY